MPKIISNSFLSNFYTLPIFFKIILFVKLEWLFPAVADHCVLDQAEFRILYKTEYSLYNVVSFYFLKYIFGVPHLEFFHFICWMNQDWVSILAWLCHPFHLVLEEIRTYNNAIVTCPLDRYAKIKIKVVQILFVDFWLRTFNCFVLKEWLWKMLKVVNK